MEEFAGASTGGQGWKRQFVWRHVTAGHTARIQLRMTYRGREVTSHRTPSSETAEGRSLHTAGGHGGRPLDSVRAGQRATWSDVHFIFPVGCKLHFHECILKFNVWIDSPPIV